METDRIGYLFSGKQLTVVVDGQSFDVGSQHPKYHQITGLLGVPEDGETQEDYEARLNLLRELCLEDTPAKALEAEVKALSLEDVQVEADVVKVRGETIRNSLTRRILDLQAAGLPYTPFVLFLVNLAQNPRKESREDLFDFLEKGKFPLTEDGCFLGYKGVKTGVLGGKETLVDNHTGTFDMAPGNFHQMPREEVDDNRNQACGAGFHVGTMAHARGFGSTIIVVKVNPRDVVSVPTTDSTKMRVCAYSSVNVYKDKQKAQEFKAPMYTETEYTNDSFEEAEEVYSSENQSREAYEKMGRDDICRLAAARGIFTSANEARWLGKDIVVEALLGGKIPLQSMPLQKVADLAVRRKLFSSAAQAKKKGRAEVERLLQEYHAAVSG